MARTEGDPWEPEPIKELRAKFRAKRLLLNLPQKEVAARMGVSQGQLADMEAGRFRPRVITLMRWAFAVEMEIDFVTRDL